MEKRKKVGWNNKVEIKQVEILAVGKACMARSCPSDTEFGRTFNSSGFSTEGTLISPSAVPHSTAGKIHYITSKSQTHYHVMHTIVWIKIFKIKLKELMAEIRSNCWQQAQHVKLYSNLLWDQRKEAFSVSFYQRGLVHGAPSVSRPVPTDWFVVDKTCFSF